MTPSARTRSLRQALACLELTIQILENDPANWDLKTFEEVREDLEAEINDELKGKAAMTQEPFKQRIVEEHEQLLERLEKLSLFVDMANDAFMDLPDAERERLYKQLVHMSMYEAVLVERRDALGIAQ